MADSILRTQLQNLVEVTKELAHRRSNIVLEIFADTPSMQFERKYPEQPWQLFNGQMLAYYHAHKDKTLSHNEHGHFHVFESRHANDSQTARHLVGLSMDLEGQPQYWFTVNQWVTGAACFDGCAFLEAIPRNPQSKPMGAVERWLEAMLYVFKDRVSSLLDNSQHVLARHNAEEGYRNLEILNDRKYYFIKSTKIDLLAGITGIKPSGKGYY